MPSDVPTTSRWLTDQRNSPEQTSPRLLTRGPLTCTHAWCGLFKYWQPEKWETKHGIRHVTASIVSSSQSCSASSCNMHSMHCTATYTSLRSGNRETYCDFTQGKQDWEAFLGWFASSIRHCLSLRTTGRACKVFSTTVFSRMPGTQWCYCYFSLF